MDATYNAVAYAFRQTPMMYDLNVTLNFVGPTRDFTPGDQIFLALRWTNATYPQQSECPACALPTADSRHPPGLLPRREPRARRRDRGERIGDDSFPPSDRSPSSGSCGAPRGHAPCLPGPDPNH